MRWKPLVGLLSPSWSSGRDSRGGKCARPPVTDAARRDWFSPQPLFTSPLPSCGSLGEIHSLYRIPCTFVVINFFSFFSLISFFFFFFRWNTAKWRRYMHNKMPEKNITGLRNNFVYPYNGSRSWWKFCLFEILFTGRIFVDRCFSRGLWFRDVEKWEASETRFVFDGFISDAKIARCVL